MLFTSSMGWNSRMRGKGKARLGRLIGFCGFWVWVVGVGFGGFAGMWMR